MKTDLVIISPSGTFTSAGLYATAEILAVRAFNGYLYVAAKNAAGTTPSVGIWRHSIGTGGALGAKELVLDWDGTGVFATRTITAFAFATNGIMYIATDSENPILVYDPSTKSIDYFYKSIVPSYCKGFCWGTQNYVYLISGNTASPAQEWTVYRLDREQPASGNDCEWPIVKTEGGKCTRQIGPVPHEEQNMDPMVNGVGPVSRGQPYFACT